jgi:hypothetical protein
MINLKKGNIDYDFLYIQRKHIIDVVYNHEKPNLNILEGLINFLDYIFDNAESEGLFTYPSLDEETGKIF